MSAFTWIISGALGSVANENEAIVKLSLFILLFALFSKSSMRLFPDNKFVVNVFSLVISLLAVRLMPLLWIMPLGKFLWVLAMAALPYLLVDAIFHNWGPLKIGLLVAAYFGAYLVLLSLDYWGFGLVFEAVKELKRYTFMYQWQSVVIGAALALLVIAQFAGKKKAEEEGHKRH
ncbi:MAG TPA: hypothetical protein HA362_01905 [Nanoarchaeota archaeon]|nr:hypothetical protein [Nanoarchaeota archaeon]